MNISLLLFILFESKDEEKERRNDGRKEATNEWTYGRRKVDKEIDI